MQNAQISFQCRYYKSSWRNKIKKEKKSKKVKGPVDSSYLNSEDEFDLEDKKPKKSVTPQKKVQKKVEPIKKVEAKVEVQTNTVEA